MSSSQHAVSGLAASIRGATESETFDLAGHSAEHITTHIRDAFSTPFPTMTEMIRLTFITGAGKLGRQKYDESAAKAVTSTLRELGFTEDRGASAVMECAGSFKLQHDTGKNLKTVVVFPLVAAASAGEDSGGNGAQQQFGNLSLATEGSQPLIAEGTPEHKLAFSSATVFERMVESKCPSWSQKKACVAALESVKATIESLDAKLLRGTPLTDPEQDLYDAVSSTSLQEKQSLVRDLMQQQVQAGRLTAAEHAQLLQQVGERLEKLNQEIKGEDAPPPKKRLQALQTQQNKALERQAMLKDLKLVAPAQLLEPLKTQSAINKLRQELAPLLEVEAAAKGRLLTLKESQAVARKDDLLEEIHQQEQASRGWFESDEAFEARLEHARSEWNAKQKASKKKKPKGTAAASSSNNKWSSVAGTSATSNKWVTPGASRAKAPSKSKPSKGKASGLFAAMMNDSDSD